MSVVPIFILVLEDEGAHAEAIRRAFLSTIPPVEIQSVSSLREYRELVAARPPDIVIMDINLPDGRAMETLTVPPENGPFPVVVMTSYGSEEVAVETMKAGALDYLVKSPEVFSNMPHTVHRVLREWNLLQKNRQAEEALRESEEKFRNLFDSAPVSLWEEDFSAVRAYFDTLHAAGILDMEAHLDAHHEEVVLCAQQIRILDVNQATVALFDAQNKTELLGSLDRLFVDESMHVFKQELLALHRARLPFRHEIIGRTLTGKLLTCLLDVTPRPGCEDSWSRVLVSVTDITERKRAEEELQAKIEELERFNKIMVGRENKMIELKKEVNELCFRLHLPKRYSAPDTVEQQR